MVTFLLFYSGFVMSILTSQMSNWRNHTVLNRPIKYTLLLFFVWQSSSIAGVFKRLPTNTEAILLENIHQPIIVFILFVMAILGYFLVFYSVAVAKLTKSLLD